ncbi:protein ZAR1-like [Gastrophryne carolinensis]
MAGYVYSPYNAYHSYGFGQGPIHPPSRGKQAAWKSGKSSAEPTDYLDNLQRAQLKAILSQVNPNLTPRLRKANTKEVGVQVNPRVDAGVQCSLGPRTLRRPPLLSKPDTSRFGRPMAVFSPFSERRFLPALASKPAHREPAHTAEEEQDYDSDDSSSAGTDKENCDEEPQKPTFQFLEQKYGYFHCKDCKTRWESAYVWCISGSNKVYFKQLCRKCQKGFNPYRVEAIQCQVCEKTRCSCPQKKRHIDLKRPHRQELCGRCKNKRVSCDNSYSFKYIV